MKKRIAFSIILFYAIYINAQIHFPDSVKTNKGKVIYLNALAKKQSNNDSIVYYYNKSIRIFKNVTCDSVLLSSYYGLSYYSYHLSKYDQSLKYALFLDSINNKCNNKFFKYKASLIFSDIYAITDKKEKALKYTNEALNIAKEMKDSIYIAESYYSLGYSYFLSELNSQSKKYFLLSLDTYNAINAKETDKYRVYTSLINVVESRKEVDYYLNKSYQITKTYKNPYYLAYYYILKGTTYKYREFDDVEAKKAALIGLKMSDSLKYLGLKNIALTDLGALETKFKNYKKAISYLNETLKLNQNNLKSKTLIYEGLIKAYEGLNNYKKAFHFSNELIVLKDSINKLNNIDKFAQFDAKFNAEQKDKEIANQQLELVKQKNNKNKLIIGGLVLLLVIYSLFQWFYNKQKRKKLSTENQLKSELEINELRTKFLGNIAHEIRTPLTLIAGNLELAKENFNEKEKAIQNIDVALTNSKKVVDDANEILELLKFEKSKITIKANVVNLDTTLKRVFFSFKSLAELKNINLIYQSVIRPDFQTKIDVQKVEKILNNLISNALKYSLSNSKIIFNANIIKDYLIVKITDFGQGIHFDETEKIFQRFYQASNSQSVGGIGIGLSLAKEFAELLNGSLTVESELTKGSTFTFSLPIREIVSENVNSQKDLNLIHRKSEANKKTLEKAPQIPKQTQNDNTKKPHILIVEDNPEMNNYLVEILAKNYHCSTAFDGLEAIEKMKDTNFDLITSDIMMPNLDGFQFRAKINEFNEFKNIPFILISAKTLTEDKIKGFQLGIDDYVIKPFNKNELIARIDNLLLHKKAREKWTLDNKTLISSEESSDKKLLKKIETIILENISNEDFKIDDLAKAVGYSQRQLTRILKQYTGMSPVKFILEIRLQKAYANLQNRTFFSLSEIRYDVGITSASYFNKKFKERFGLMPNNLLN